MWYHRSEKEKRMGFLWIFLKEAGLDRSVVPSLLLCLDTLKQVSASDLHLLNADNLLNLSDFRLFRKYHYVRFTHI